MFPHNDKVSQLQRARFPPSQNLRYQANALPVLSNDDLDKRFVKDLKRRALKVFDVHDLLSDSKNEINLKPKNLVAIGSYNYADKVEPTIVVPGSPKIWNPPILPFTVSRDAGTVYRDQNSSRFSESPLSPTMIAVKKCTPTFEWSSVDLLTDRNALRKLLRWIRGIKGRDFRIDVQLVGKKTVVFDRWEPVLVEGSIGYGFSFEKYTTREAASVEDGVSHNRIVAYDYDGIKIVMRFEVDACLQSEDKSPTPNLSKPRSRYHNEDDISALAEGLSSLNIVTPTERKSTQPEVREAGSLVPQESLIELSTVSDWNLKSGSFDWTELYPQLFLSQTPHYYLGIHIRGRFKEIRKMKLGETFFADQERKLQDDFRKLGVALGVIKSAVVDLGVGKKLSLVYREGRLSLFERINGRSCLPEEWLKVFDNTSDSE